MGLRVFISYSHKDEELQQELLAHLRPLTRDGTFTVWHDRLIQPGEEWRKGIETALAECDLALLLISSDFLNSDFCIDEEVAVLLQRREQEGVTVVPLILRPCYWQRVPWLARLQAVPKDGQPVVSPNWSRDEALLQAVQALDSLLEQRTATALPPSVAAAPQPEVSLAKLPATGRELFGRDAELERLDVAWESPHTHVVTVVGFGGVGKSALTNRWLARVRRDGYRGAQRVYAWSFYSQGTREETGSADQFINAALIFFGDPDPTKGSPWDKGERLAQLIRRQPTLLVLDGVEPLQSSASGDYGKIKDPGLDCLLRELASGMDGLCLVSGRVELTDLAGFDTVQQIGLDRLSPEAGRALLQSAGVRGTDEELSAAVEEYQGHALALVLLAEYLWEFHNGDITRRGDVPLFDEETPQGSHAFRVMAAYDAALKRDGREVERAVLRIVGLFDRPAAEGCLDALRAEPTIAGVTGAVVGLSDDQWQHAVANLRRLRLVLAPQVDDGSLDAHPLVREYFGRKLEHEACGGFRRAHRRLYEHLRDTTKQLPDTLAEMAPLFQAIYHGCRAGRQADALHQVYLRRIARVRDFADRVEWHVYHLGLCSEILAALAGFFDKPWRTPSPFLRPRDQGIALNSATLCLGELGRPREASEAAAAAMRTEQGRRKWSLAALNANNLLYWRAHEGDLALAAVVSREERVLAERSADLFDRARACANEGWLHHLAGRLAAAREAFSAANGLQQMHDLRRPRVYNHLGMKHSLLLLSLGESAEALDLAVYGFRNAEADGWVYYTAQFTLRQGQALHQMVSRLPAAPPHHALPAQAARAREALDAAVAGTHRVRSLLQVPEALLARASFHRDFGDHEQARRDLNEALTLSTRFGFRLHETDARLLDGHMALDGETPDVATAEAALARAEALVEETGYHLRDADLLILEGRLVALRDDREAGRKLLEQAISVARREEAENAVYQAALDEAGRYLRDL